jgi:uncharacterized protein YjbJ (UPF0337 family)
VADPIETTKGKLKEAAGALTDSESLKREGQAQQDEEEAKDRAAMKEAEAREARAEVAEEAAEQERHSS